MRRCFLAILVPLFVAAAKLYAAEEHIEVQFRETTYKVNADGSFAITAHERWRALTGTGRSQLSRIRINYSPEFQTAEFRSVRTLKKDGALLDADPASAFDTPADVNINLPLYEDSRSKTILPPNLEIGDSVEFEAVTRVAKWIKPGDFWLEHYAVTGVRVLSEVVVLDLPADRKTSLFEAPGGKVQVSGGRRIERWELRNPAVKEVSVESEPPVFKVSSLLTWDEIAQWVHSLNESASAPTPEIKALAEKLIANQATEQARITLLYSYVATKIRYTSLFFGLGRIQPHSAATVLHNGFGDCKDQSALLTALLRAAGFKTRVVLAHPAAGVAVPEVPDPNQFNHEFLAVETKDGLLFLDPSIGLAPPGVLQPGVRGRTALVMSDSSASVLEIPIASPVPNRVASSLKGKISAAGAFEGTSRFELRGLLEGPFRRLFADASQSQKEDLARALAGREFKNAAVSAITATPIDDLSQPFVVQYRVSDEKFFSSSSANVRIGSGVSMMSFVLRDVKKPEKPLPIESTTVIRNMDLLINPSFMITNGMPVRRKASFGTLDSEFSYKDGHELLAFSMNLNGTPVAPRDWKSFLDFLGATETDQALSFKLERQPAPTMRPYLKTLDKGAAGQIVAYSKAMEQGAAAYKQKEYTAAKQAYLEATKLSPQSKFAWNDLGRAYHALHEYDAAEKAYRKQIEVNPSDPYAYNNLGLTLRRLKRPEEAVAAFRKQIGINPSDRFAHENLSISLMASKNYPEALEEQEIAVSLVPDDLNNLLRLVRLQLKTARPDEARKTFEKMLALPHDPIVENNVAYFLADAGVDLEKDWELASAVLESESRLVCRPEKPETNDKCSAHMERIASILDTTAWILYRQGKINDAEPYVRSAYAISKGATIALHGSMILAKLGRSEEAAKVFNDARARADFANIDTEEVEQARSVIGSAGGLHEITAAPKEGRVQVSILVDESGKVLDASGPADAATAAKALTISPIEWPGHRLRTVRTAELIRDGAGWKLYQSFINKPAQEVEP